MSVRRIAMGYRNVGPRRELRYLIEYAPGARCAVSIFRIVLKDKRRNRNRVKRVVLEDRQIDHTGAQCDALNLPRIGEGVSRHLLDIPRLDRH